MESDQHAVTRALGLVHQLNEELQQLRDRGIVALIEVHSGPPFVLDTITGSSRPSAPTIYAELIRPLGSSSGQAR